MKHLQAYRMKTECAFHESGRAPSINNNS